ncbi:DUF4097 family beta strand repeat-containing protein [Gorillibacterium timonense]|uniref:DUF4097 family beta strand repeat-containing protein n=1 Tax=Gorillibacterium timonense TaxID=1689269 RepID=UPI00071CFD2E|nr:DUF4097 family beta strand repeat-containing protein [Gorillibacterium timonense]
MKRPFWIVGLLLLCAGLIWFGTLTYRAVFASDVVSSTQVEENKRVNSAEIDTIRVQATSTDVQVTAYDGEQIDVELKGNAAKNGNVELWTEQKGSVLKVEVRMKRKLFFSFSSSLDLVIKVPEKEFDEIRVQTVSGDQELSGLQTKELGTESVSGDVTVQNSTGKTSVKTVSGEQTLEKIQGDSLTAASTSGTIQVRESDYTTLSLKSVSGDLVLEDVSGETTAKTTSGNLDVELIKMVPVSAHSVSGDIQVITPQEAVYEVKGKTVSGSIRTNSKDFQVVDSSKGHYSGNTGKEGPVIDVETVSGNIEIGD